MRCHHLRLGTLTVSGRSGTDRLSTEDLRLLDLARHVGITLHAARLSAAVQTSRERNVLQLMARGLSNDTIAGRLSLSPTTVRNYVSAVFTKLRVASRAEAIVRAREAGVE